VSSLRSWRRGHPVAFFFLGEIIGIAVFLLSAFAGGSSAPGSALWSITLVVAGIAALAIVVLLVAGLVSLGRYLFFSRSGGGQENAAEPRAGDVESERREEPGKTARTRARSTDGSAADRTVKVLVLGDSGSGKTTMLAALYYTFVHDSSTGIRFRTDNASHGLLMDHVQAIKARDTGFPAGTATSRTWRFSVQVASHVARSTAFTLEYLDYPGIFLQNWSRSEATLVGEPPDERFEQAMAESDVLMGILDGAEIRKLMRGTSDQDALSGINWLLTTLVRAEKRNIHLMVTKWDLLRGENGESYQPGQIVDRLRQESFEFRSFWDDSQRGGVRIIPVAALGTNGFVEPKDPSNPKAMQKVQGKDWEPWQVTVPFYCIVPDIIEQDVIRATSRPGAPLAKITRIVVGLVYGLKVAVPPVGPFKFGDLPVGKILVTIWQYMHDKKRQGKVAASLHEDSAISYVLSECKTQVKKFEGDYPDSRPRPSSGAPDDSE